MSYYSPPLSRYQDFPIKIHDLLINPDPDEKPPNVSERYNLYSAFTKEYATFLPKQLIEKLHLDTYVESSGGEWLSHLGLAYISFVIPSPQKEEVKKIADMGINAQLYDISERSKFCTSQAELTKLSYDKLRLEYGTYNGCRIVARFTNTALEKEMEGICRYDGHTMTIDGNPIYFSGREIFHPILIIKKVEKRRLG
jgi:hypothetical protein